MQPNDLFFLIMMAHITGKILSHSLNSVMFSRVKYWRPWITFTILQAFGANFLLEAYICD